MICKFCRSDIAAALLEGAIVVICTEHLCEVCPRCYRCQGEDDADAARVPKNPAEWQDAVDKAEFLTSIDNCRRSGLISTEISFDMLRCRQVLEVRRKLGFTPAPIEELCRKFMPKNPEPRVPSRERLGSAPPANGERAAS